jgi:hypothetical protein
MLVLAGLGHLEHKLLRARRTLSATIRTKPGVSLEWLKTQLFSDGLTIAEVKSFDHEDDRVFEMLLSGPARQFEISRATMLDLPEVLNVNFD